MTNEILEQIISKGQLKFRDCKECSKKYNFQKRQEEVKSYATPNTAVEYCSNRCWGIGTALEESG